MYIPRLDLILLIVIAQGLETDWGTNEPLGGHPICTRDTPCGDEKPKETKEEKKEEKIEPSKEKFPVQVVDKLDKQLEKRKSRLPRNIHYTVKTQGSYEREYKVDNRDEVFDLLYDRFRADPRIDSVIVEDRSGKKHAKYVRNRYGKWEVD